MDNEIPHGDILSIGISSNNQIQIEYWDVMGGINMDGASAFLILNKKQCLLIYKFSKLVKE